jgi:predicted Fe-Mo cluster-binding NifX family protein
MKIAVPTNDGLRITPDLGQTEAFLVITVKAEEIVSEELRNNRLNTYLTNEKGPLALIEDCSVVLVNHVDLLFCEMLKANHMECINTSETLITNALLQYLKHEYRRESNTCCCP